ncbi:ribosomal oxygenase 1 [Ranitomeya variabilis]|uniref:ribosomal oxygenase 1 n=1 Tax=Ranitomeya variabilis TaxID=490064 RepID=UPI00405757C0
MHGLRDTGVKVSTMPLEYFDTHFGKFIKAEQGKLIKLMAGNKDSSLLDSVDAREDWRPGFEADCQRSLLAMQSLQAGEDTGAEGTDLSHPVNCTPGDLDDRLFTGWACNRKATLGREVSEFNLSTQAKEKHCTPDSWVQEHRIRQKTIHQLVGGKQPNLLPRGRGPVQTEQCKPRKKVLVCVKTTIGKLDVRWESGPYKVLKQVIPNGPVYLTPPSTQGFAPHYDDIEAFVVQLEGKKHWRVYNPRNSSEMLPQFSSVNFSDSDLGEPILETILEAGDLLYFPRGFIHQGDCLPDAHSLHITVSSFQRNSWVDLLHKLLPAALQIAAEDDVQFRQGLPLDYLDYMGVQNAELSDPRRGNFTDKVQFLIRKLAEYAPVDAAVDQKAKTFLHDCLPPVLTPAEKDHSVYGAPARWENGDVTGGIIQLEKDTQIRFLRHGIVRLCSEGEVCLLYYSTENSRVYHQAAPKSMEVDAEHMDAIEYLIHCYPQYATVESLPCEDLDDKLAVANMLFEKGLLTTKERLTPLSRTVATE